MKHRVISCLGSPIEQDHRGIKQRYYPALGFKAQKTAAVFCRAYDEVRNYFRPWQKMGQEVSLSRWRELFTGRYFKLQDQFCMAANTLKLVAPADCNLNLAFLRQQLHR